MSGKLVMVGTVVYLQSLAYIVIFFHIASLTIWFSLKGAGVQHCGTGMAFTYRYSGAHAKLLSYCINVF